jgi:hypothetical protein
VQLAASAGRSPQLCSARAVRDFVANDMVSRKHFDARMSEMFVKLPEVEAQLKVHVAEVESRILIRQSEADRRIAEITAGASTNLAVTDQKYAETRRKIAEFEVKTVAGRAVRPGPQR